MKAVFLASILLSAFTTVLASSPPPKPFKRIAYPRTLSLEILPRQPSSPNPDYFIDHRAKRSLAGKRSYTPSTSNGPLRHSDSFRLTLEAFDDLFHLHLSPNKDLIHEAARIVYYAPDGTIRRTEPLRPQDHRIYHGVVMHPDYTHERLREDIAGGVESGGLGDGELGWARIMVHDHGDIPNGRPPTFEGAFTVKGVTYHVQSREKYERNKHKMDPAVEVLNLDSHLVMFRDSDIDHDFDDPSSKPHSCSHDSSAFNSEKMKNPRVPFSEGLDSGDAWWQNPRSGLIPRDLTDLDAGLYKRDDISGNVTSNYIDRIGSTQGCSTTQTIVYMGVAADCEYVSHHGGASNATSAILNNWNTASALYKKTFNVSLGIVELAVQDPTCPSSAPASAPWNVACSTSTNLNTRLSLFSQWRGDKGSSDGAGLWHLMSGCPTGTEVGVAWLQQLCVTSAIPNNGEVVSGTGVSTAASTEWQVVAHEIGHNFGAIHDCSSGCTLSDNCCPLSRTTCDANSAFIMSAVSQSTENSFSQCTIGNICAAMSAMDTTCIQPLDGSKQTLTLKMCGNGIVEDGEDCDPGVGATSNCCDSSTCKFINNAQCDPQSSDCCTDQCAFAPSTQVCRPVRDAACDTQELCSGTSSACPKDQTMANGVSCGDNGLACANGACTSKDLQCQTQGVSLGLTKACPQTNDRSCRVSCLDPRNSGQCIILQAALIDGSPCGYGGTCQNSTCVSGSALDTFKSWYRSNLQIAIPVTIVVGIIVLLILWSLFKAILRCCTARKTGAKRIPSVVSTNGRQRLGSWGAPAMNPPYPPPGFNEYAMRDQPNTSTRGYTTPGTDYPPAHTEDPNNVVGREQSRWVDDTIYNGRR